MIEKYARAAASTARTPPNSPARRTALEAENTARVAAEQFVAELEAERDALRARLAEIEAQEPVAQVVDWPDDGHSLGISVTASTLERLGSGSKLYAHPIPAQAVPDVKEFRTSREGRAEVVRFFSEHLRRNDFARYINDTLAADFACALAPTLHAVMAAAPEYKA